MPKKPNTPDRRMMTVTFKCPETWLPDIPAMLKMLADKNANIGLPVDLPSLLEQIEWRYIDCALAQTDGNVQDAANLLGINRTTLAEKIRRKGPRK